MTHDEIARLMKARFPNVIAMSGRILGKDRKGRKGITPSKTALWLEIQELVEAFMLKLEGDPADPYRPQREALAEQVRNKDEVLEALHAELIRCEGRSAGLERLVVAGRMVRDEWARSSLDLLRLRTSIREARPELAKALDRLTLIAGTVTDETPEGETP